MRAVGLIRSICDPTWFGYAITDNENLPIKCKIWRRSGPKWDFAWSRTRIWAYEVKLNAFIKKKSNYDIRIFKSKNPRTYFTKCSQCSKIPVQLHYLRENRSKPRSSSWNFKSLQSEEGRGTHKGSGQKHLESRSRPLWLQRRRARASCRCSRGLLLIKLQGEQTVDPLT